MVQLAALAFTSLAHDPYEITSTLSLYSNRSELHVEMEARTALLFAGHSAPVSSEQLPELFTSLHQALSDTGSRLLQFTAAGREIYPETTSVLLGVEDHIQFNLHFPRLRSQTIRCEPRALQALTNEGPYGISLTVLDMVNKKVLGQSVLFKDSSAAEFPSSSKPSSPPLSEALSSAPSATPAVVKLSRSDLDAAPESSASASPSPAPVQPSPSPLATSAKTAPILAAITFFFASTCSLIVFLRAKRKARPI